MLLHFHLKSMRLVELGFLLRLILFQLLHNWSKWVLLTRLGSHERFLVLIELVFILHLL
jgi:hypothetical protein